VDLWSHCFLNQPPIFDLGLCCFDLADQSDDAGGVSTSAAIGMDPKAANLYTSLFPQESSLLQPRLPRIADRLDAPPCSILSMINFDARSKHRQLHQ
jgi:hypothetical protein